MTAREWTGRGIGMVAFAFATAATPVPAEPIAAERLGLYVVSDDLARASAFYEALLGKPQFRLPGMIGFDVAGGLYAVVDRTAYAATAIRGNTVRGYIRVRDIRAAHAAATRVSPAGLATGIVDEGRFKFFRMRDPDGNLIEFYAIQP